MFQILDGYVERVNSPGSRLARIVGVYRLKPIDQDFIIMENLISNKANAVAFDIKGSSHDRLVPGKFDYSQPPYGRVLKDLNLRHSGFKFNLDPSPKEILINEINKDFKMLAENGIMDYSVLVAFYQDGVQKKTRYDINGISDLYSIGIIDFLQRYNIQKRSETYLKKILFRNEEISSEEPMLYCNRISAAMSDIFDNHNN